MQMINALVKTRDKNNRHTQFLTSAPNVRGSVNPSDPAFPSPWVRWRSVYTQCQWPSAADSFTIYFYLLFVRNAQNSHKVLNFVVTVYFDLLARFPVTIIVFITILTQVFDVNDGTPGKAVIGSALLCYVAMSNTAFALH